MALQHEETKDALQIVSGRFVVDTSVKQQQLIITLNDKITKNFYKSSFSSSDLLFCGFNEGQAGKLETIGVFIEKAQSGQNGLKLSISVPKEGDNNQQHQLTPGDGDAEIVIICDDNIFGKVKYTLKLNEVERDIVDINADSIDDIKEDILYMRERLRELNNDYCIAKQHQMPKGSIIQWYGSKNKVPNFWEIQNEDTDDDGKDEADEGPEIVKDIFTYESDFDKNGILYAIGSDYGIKEWENPSETKRVEIRTASGMGRVSKPKHQFVGREAAEFCNITPIENSWFSIDFKDLFIRPTNYTLRHDGAESNMGHLRNWQFQGSNDGDGDNWDTLIEHKDDKGLHDPNGTCTWFIKDIKKFYQYFRIYMTGKTSSQDWLLCCAGFEIYGEIKRKDQEDGAPKKMYTLRKIV